MILIGVLLVLLAAAAGVVLFAGTAQLTDTVDIDVLGGTLSLPPLTLLVTGMVVITVFWLGWALLRGGLRRGKRRRVEAKEAAAAAQAQRAEDERRMQDEFAARERQLLEERRRNDEQSALLRGQGDADVVGSDRADLTGRGTDRTGPSDEDVRGTDAADRGTNRSTQTDRSTDRTGLAEQDPDRNP